jgi:hypothetical protein
VAALGTREYSNQKFDGGHIRGTAFGGPPDHLNKFPQDRDQNQGNGDSIETSWYRLERDLQSAIEDKGAVVTSWNFIGSNEINPDAATPDTVALLLTVAFPPAFNNVTMARSFPNVR